MPDNKPANQGWSFVPEAEQAPDWQFMPEPLAPATQRFVKGVIRGANPLPLLAAAGKIAIGSPKQQMEGLEALAAPYSYMWQRAQEAWRQGRIPAAAVYAAGMTPLAGPLIVGTAEQIAQGDVAGPVGELVGAGLVGAAGRVAPRVLRAAGKDTYKAALSMGQKVPRQVKEAAARRGVESGLGIGEESLSRLQSDIGAARRQVESITSGPAAQTAVPVKDVLSDVDSYLARVFRIDKQLWRDLKRRREAWARELETGPTPSGSPPPGGGMTTVEKAQQIKQDIDAALSESAYSPGADPTGKTLLLKKGQRGLKQQIERAVPEDVAALNAAIRRDIYLQKAIERAINRDPNWVKDWAVFALGGGAATALIGEMMGSPAVTAGGTAAAAGALARMAARNPRIMARTGILLHRAGEYLPPEMFRYPLLSIPMARAQEQDKQ